MAPESSTCCTKPIPQPYGIRTKGVRPLRSPAHAIALVSAREKVECSRSMKRASKPAFLASWTIKGFVVSLIPNAYYPINEIQGKRAEVRKGDQMPSHRYLEGERLSTHLTKPSPFRFGKQDIVIGSHLEGVQVSLARQRNC